MSLKFKASFLFIIIIIFLTCIDVFLIIQKLSIRKRANQLNEVNKHFIVIINEENKLVGKSLKFIKDLPKTQKKDDRSWFIISLVSMNDCSSCFDSIISMADEFSRNETKFNFKVFGILLSDKQYDLERIKKEYAIQFPFMQQSLRLFNQHLKLDGVSTPCLLLCDPQFNIFFAKTIDYKNPDYFFGFYQHLRSIFNE